MSQNPQELTFKAFKTALQAFLSTPMDRATAEYLAGDPAYAEGMMYRSFLEGDLCDAERGNGAAPLPSISDKQRETFSTFLAFANEIDEATKPRTISDEEKTLLQNTQQTLRALAQSCENFEPPSSSLSNEQKNGVLAVAVTLEAMAANMNPMLSSLSLPMMGNGDNVVAFSRRTTDSCGSGTPSSGSGNAVPLTLLAGTLDTVVKNLNPLMSDDLQTQIRVWKNVVQTETAPGVTKVRTPHRSLLETVPTLLGIVISQHDPVAQEAEEIHTALQAIKDNVYSASLTPYHTRMIENIAKLAPFVQS